MQFRTPNKFQYIYRIIVQLSGLWSSSFYLGSFLGPSVAGFLVDAYGFEWTGVIFSILYGIAICINACEIGYTFCIQKEKFLIPNNENIDPA